MHISTLNKRSMPGLKFSSKLGKSRMSWCLDTNHFVFAPPSFRLILWIFIMGGGGKFVLGKLP